MKDSTERFAVRWVSTLQQESYLINFDALRVLVQRVLLRERLVVSGLLFSQILLIATLHRVQFTSLPLR
jgi:hypothetical protein